MALALLDLEETNAARVLFAVDIGSSRWFSYTIGEGQIINDDGFEILAGSSYTSPLIGPLSPESLGRTYLDVSADQFKGENRYIQLVSYRAEPNLGPSVSDIVYVGRKTTEMHKPNYTPIRSATTSISHTTLYPSSRGRGAAISPFVYEESIYSDSMFLESLAPILNAVLPVISNVLPSLGGLFGGGKSSGVGVGGAPTGNVVNVLTPQMLQQIAELVKQLLATSGKTTASSVNGAGGVVYSEAKIAPALLAALPALMPIAEKLLNPETIKAITDNSPLNMAAKANEQIRQHLERILPSSDTTQWMQLLALLSQSSSLHTIMPEYQTAPGTELKFVPSEPIPVGSRPRRLYRSDRPANFILTLETPRAIVHPKLCWQVRRAESAEALIEEERELETIAGSGPLAVSVTLPPADLQRLTLGDDHILCAYLLWETRSGRTLGIEATLSFAPVGEFIFDRVLGGEEILALNDVDRYRDFWHKVWQTTMTDEVNRYRYECKYYYGVDAAAEHNARGVTRVQDNPRELHTQEGRLESSLSLSLYTLNGLLTDVMGQKPLLEPELSALRATAYVQQFRAASRFEARFGGKVGTSVALWVFPEMRLQSIRLLKCESVDENGNVRTVSDLTIVFPMPATAHFIGVTTDM
jgi:hypothetical protein